MSKKRFMIRSMQQSIYKYLLDGYADFELEDNYSVSSIIIGWNTIKSESENKERILYEIEKKLSKVSNSKDDTTDIKFDNYAVIKQEEFFNNLNMLKTNAFDVEYLIGHEDSKDEFDIATAIRPYVFYCSKCRRVHVITDYGLSESSKYLNNYKYRINEIFNPKKHKCLYCNGSLKQQQLIRITPYGTAYDHEPNCEIHKENTEYFISKNSVFDYYCSQCNKIIHRKFNQLDKLTPSLDPSVIFPQLVSILDIKNDEEIKEIKKYDGLSKLLILRHLGIIDYNEYSMLKEELIKLEKMKAEGSPKFKLDYIRSDVKKYIDKFDYPKFDTFVEENTNLFYNNVASRIIDINEIEDNRTANIDEIIKTNSDEVSDSKNVILNLLKNLMVEDIYISENVPINNIVFGYTRFHPEIGYDLKSEAILNVYKKGDKYKFYQNKLETEGVYIKFDQDKMLKWLKENIFDENDNKLFSDKEGFKELEFFNHYITSIDKNEIIETTLHTLSHLFMQELSNVSGIEVSSMSELLFAETASVFIYATSTEGIVLNSIKTAVLKRLEQLLKRVVDSVNNCNLKPICESKETSACIGCVYISEISCYNFNYLLNRKLLQKTSSTIYIKGSGNKYQLKKGMLI